MTWEEHYKSLENMYNTAPMQDFYRDSAISVSEGRATISLPIHQGFFHAGNAVHGSVYFRMLDDAAYFAVSSKIQEHFIVTSSFNIELLRPAVSGIIKAEGSIRFTSSRYVIGEAVLLNEQGKELAFGSGKFVQTNLKLSEQLGYRL